MKDEINLKLLKTIHTIVSCGSVTEAARILNQSPGNISYQLAKARKIVNSELFVRTKLGMSPSPAALELSQRYQKYIDIYSASLEPGSPSSRAVINVNSWPLLEMIYLMNASLDQTSPLPFQYKFQSYVNDVDSRVSALKSYQIDVDIGSKLPPDNNVTAIKLFSSDVIILAGKLPENGTLQLSQQEWESSRHAVWAGSVDFYSENVEGAIRATDFMQSRNVKFISSNMVNMASVCAKNDCIMLVPSLVAPMLMKLFALHQLSLPVGLKLNSDCYLHFHEKLTQEPELLESIRDVITRLQAMLSSE